MTELFEIGVSLALSDNVSSEIAKVKREILSLSSVLSAGGISPERLSATAGRSSAPATISSAGTQAVFMSPAEGASYPTGREGLHNQRAHDGYEPKPEPPLQILKVSQPFSAGQPYAPTLLEPARLNDYDRWPEMPPSSAKASPPQHTFIVQTASVSPASVPPLGARSPVPASQNTAPLLAIPRSRTRSAVPSYAPKIPEPSAPLGPAPIFLATTGRRPWEEPKRPEAEGSSGRLLPNQRAAAPLQTSPQLQRDKSSERNRHASERTPNNETARSPGPPEAQHLAESAAPQMHEANAQRIQGDVYLDGTLVGRWLSRAMTRDAERASAGRTGFDVRRGRLLPGPTVG